LIALFPAYFTLPALSPAYRALSHFLLLIALYLAFSPLRRFITLSLAFPCFLLLTMLDPAFSAYCT
jgi:hypothetical protein